MIIITRVELKTPEYKTIERAAHAKGQSVEIWIKHVALAAARKMERPTRGAGAKR